MPSHDVMISALSHLPVAAESDLGYQRQSDTPLHSHLSTFPRTSPQQHSVSDLVHTRRRLPQLPVIAADPVLPYCQSDIQSRMPSTRDTADPPYTDTPSRQPEHTFSRSAAAVTSMLPGQPTEMPLSTTTRIHPPAVPMHDAPPSALPRPHAAPGDLPTGDDIIQRPAAPVDSRNLYTHSIDCLLADLTPPMHVPTQPIVPLSSENTQTTASRYVNIDSVPPLSTQRYANLPYYLNTTPYGSAPSSQPIELGQSNVIQPTTLHAAPYTFDT